jgi:hypothetical protein
MRKGVAARIEREKKKKERDENSFMGLAGNLILSFFGRHTGLQTRNKDETPSSEHRSFHKAKFGAKRRARRSVSA